MTNKIQQYSVGKFVARINNNLIGDYNLMLDTLHDARRLDDGDFERGKTALQNVRHILGHWHSQHTGDDPITNDVDRPGLASLEPNRVSYVLNDVDRDALFSWTVDDYLAWSDDDESGDDVKQRFMRYQVIAFLNDYAIWNDQYVDDGQLKLLTDNEVQALLLAVVFVQNEIDSFLSKTNLSLLSHEDIVDELRERLTKLLST